MDLSGMHYADAFQAIATCDDPAALAATVEGLHQLDLRNACWRRLRQLQRIARGADQCLQ
jgi:hypothetical protein